MQQFEIEQKVSLNTYVRQLYRAFNGFSLMDHRSLIKLSPLQDVAENWEFCTDIGGQHYFPAGDFLIYSDIVMFPLGSETSTVIYLEERRQLATNTPEFFEKLIAGAFDLPDPTLA